MTALPLTLIGVVLALLTCSARRLSMFSIIGVVMLMGLVTKNAILLVDFAIRAREEHVTDDPGPALCPACPAQRGPAARRARAAAPHPHDHAGHDLSAWCPSRLP
jgi:HAE1 family hydrophobic/amphiphilic exporter-1